MSRRLRTALLCWATVAVGFGACNPSTVFYDPTGKTCTAGGTDCPDGWSCVPSTTGADYVCWPTADAGAPSTEPDSGLIFTVDGGRDAGPDAGRDGGLDAGDAGQRDAGVDAGDAGGRDAGFDAGNVGDAGEKDAGVDAGSDAGEQDAGVGGDAGERDAGVDAGLLDAGPHCTISGQTVTPGTPNPANACQSCQPASSTTGWSNLPDGTGCGGAELCSSGACSNVCDIGGSIVDANASDPANACEECTPAASTSSWSPLADGTSCDAGMICLSGNCLAECDIGGSDFTPGTPNPTNACQSCQPASSTAGWSNLADGTGCGGTRLCSGGVCSSVCDIGGTIVAANTVEPTNPCMICLPATSNNSWSAQPQGLSCGAGEICVAGACSADCDIGGSIVTAGTSPASNPCVSCQPSVSTAAYSDVVDGTACGTGLSCVAGACCGGTHGTLTCGGSQVDTCLDDLNCGSCGAACSEPNGCFAGVCQLPAAMPVALDSLAAATGPDGRIYAIGGFSAASDLSVDTVNAFNPRTNLWTAETSLLTAVMYMGAAADSTGIFAMGGYSCTTTTTCTNGTGTTENFGQFLNTSTGVWTKTSNAPVEVSDNDPAVGPGGIFFMPGGFNGTATLTQLLRFTPSGVGAGGTWTNTGPALAVGTDYLGDTAGLDGTVYAIGGTSTYSSPLADVQTLKSGATSWSLAANLPTPRCEVAAATDAAGLIYAIGGDDCGYCDTCTLTIYGTNEIFNPTLGSWSEGPTLPNSVTFSGSTVGPEGRIYVIGGWDGSSDQAYVQVYDPVNGYWIP